MFIVQFALHGGRTSSFQMPCRFAGWRAGAGAGDEQVAAVLEDEGDERGVLAVAVGAEALVGRTVGRRRAEVEADAAEEARVVGDVRVAQRRRTASRRPRRAGRGRAASASRPSRAGRLVEAVEARGRGHEAGRPRRPPAPRAGPRASSRTVPPRATARTIAVKRMPSASRALVVADGRPSSRRGSWGRRGSARGRAARSRRRLRRVARAQRAVEPGGERDLPGPVRAARTTITWSGKLAKTSRVWMAPPARNVVVATARSRSSSRR